MATLWLRKQRDPLSVTRRQTHSLANTPLKAAQAPLATAKKIHCVLTLQEPTPPLPPPRRRPSAMPGSDIFFWTVLGSIGLGNWCGFFLSRTMSGCAGVSLDECGL